MKQGKNTKILLLLAAVLSAAGMAAYMKSGVTEFTPELSCEALTAYGIGILLCVFSLFREFKVLKFIGYLALFYACLESICVQATYIANVVVSIDGNTFSKGFLATAICSLLGAILALLSVLFQRDRKEEVA